MYSFRELRVQLAVVQEEVRLVRSEVDIWRKEAERTLASKENQEEKEQVIFFSVFSQEKNPSFNELDSL